MGVRLSAEVASHTIDDLPAAIKALVQKFSDEASQTRFLADYFDTTTDALKKAMDANPGLVDAWKKMDDLGADAALKKNPGALDALSKPQFERPDPSTYLSKEYIDNHLKNFAEGITKFVPETPTGAIGPPGPGGTFAMSKLQADDLIRQAGGDVHKLEYLLGLDRGYLGSNPVRIDVSKPSGLRMPTGNELGANDKWIPGGKTSGRILEVTVDRIQPGTYTTGSVF